MNKCPRCEADSREVGNYSEIFLCGTTVDFEDQVIITSADCRITERNLRKGDES